MLDVGVGLLGASEPAAVSVRAVCRSTGITERYFYEAFGSRDEFVRAVYDDVSVRARDALIEAVRGTTDPAELPRAAVARFVELVVDRPDVGRVLLIAPLRETALAERGLGRMPEFFSVVAGTLPPGVGDETRQMVAVSVVGSLTALFTEFLSDRLEVTRAQLVGFCVDVVTTTARRFE